MDRPALRRKICHDEPRREECLSITAATRHSLRDEINPNAPDCLVRWLVADEFRKLTGELHKGVL
jgi:hypothetical protein